MKATRAKADLASDPGGMLWCCGGLIPRWYCEAGPISIYCATRDLLPAKTRVFVDVISEAFRRNRVAERFAASFSQHKPGRPLQNEN